LVLGSDRYRTHIRILPGYFTCADP